MSDQSKANYTVSYGGAGADVHVQCRVEVDRLRADLQAREATVLRLVTAARAAVGLLILGTPAWDVAETLRDALDAVPRRAGTGEVVGRVHRLPDADASAPRGFGNVPPAPSPEVA